MPLWQEICLYRFFLRVKLDEEIWYSLYLMKAKNYGFTAIFATMKKAVLWVGIRWGESRYDSWIAVVCGLSCGAVCGNLTF